MNKSKFLLLEQMQNVERLKRTQERIKKMVNPDKPFDCGIIGSPLEPKNPILVPMTTLDEATYTGFTISPSLINNIIKGHQVSFDDLGDVIKIADMISCNYVAEFVNGNIVTTWRKDYVTGEWDEIL